MQILIDRDVLGYCQDSDEDRQSAILSAESAPFKPVYSLPVFELCRSVHLLAKFHQVPPSVFRECWAELSESHLEHSGDGYFIHVCEYPEDGLVREVLQLGDISADKEDEEDYRYWDYSRSLTTRLRKLHPLGTKHLEEVDADQRQWMATVPEGKREQQSLRFATADDFSVVLDTNNLLELLNVLPPDGNLVSIPRFSGRLCSKAVHRFRKILQDNYGLPGRFIVPVSALEETERVAQREGQQYANALKVLDVIKFEPDRALWQIFRFESLIQEVLECFIQLYEGIAVRSTNVQNWPGFADMLVLAHGLYNGCPVASNEWFEKHDWDIVAQVFPHLVLED